MEHELVGLELFGGGLGGRVAGALADGLDGLPVLPAEVHRPAVERVAAVLLIAAFAVERPVDELGELVRVADLDGVEGGAVGAGEEAAFPLGVEEAEAAEAGVGEGGGEDALAGPGGAAHGHHEAALLRAAAEGVDAGHGRGGLGGGSLTRYDAWVPIVCHTG